MAPSFPCDFVAESADILIEAALDVLVHPNALMDYIRGQAQLPIANPIEEIHSTPWPWHRICRGVGAERALGDAL